MSDIFLFQSQLLGACCMNRNNNIYCLEVYIKRNPESLMCLSITLSPSMVPFGLNSRT